MDNFYSQANFLTRFGPARVDKSARGCEEMPTSRLPVLWERISSLGVDKLRVSDSGSPPTPDQVQPTWTRRVFAEHDPPDFVMSASILLCIMANIDTTSLLLFDHHFFSLRIDYRELTTKTRLTTTEAI